MPGKSANAAAAARIMWLPMLVRLLALACATASVVGVIAFFLFDSIHPYRWYLLIGGSLGSGLFGWIGDRISPTREMVAQAREELMREGAIGVVREEQKDA